MGRRSSSPPLLAFVLIGYADLTALGGTTALLLLCVFAIVNVAVLVLRRDPVEHKHFRAPTALPVLGAVALRLPGQPAVGPGEQDYKIAGWLMLVGVGLWALTWLLNKYVFKRKADFDPSPPRPEWPGQLPQRRSRGITAASTERGSPASRSGRIDRQERCPGNDRELDRDPAEQRYPAPASIASPPSHGPSVIPTLNAEKFIAVASVGASPARLNTRALSAGFTAKPKPPSRKIARDRHHRAVGASARARPTRRPAR